MKATEQETIAVEELFVRLMEGGFQGREEGGWYDLGRGEGIFSGALTIWMMILQGMLGVSMKDVVALLQSGVCDLLLNKNQSSKRVKEKRFPRGTGGYAEARKRLPVVDVEDVVDVINDGLMQEAGGQTGQRIVLIDGTTAMIERTKDLIKKYEFGRNQHGRNQLPKIRIVFGVDLVSGVSTNPQFGPLRKSEQRLSAKVIEQIEDGSLIVADRNFGVFSVVSHTDRCRKEVLVRLTDSRAKKLGGKDDSDKKKIVDQEVVWERSRHDKLLKKDDPLEVKGRLIRAVIQRPGFKTQKLKLFTTSCKPAEELITIYGLRWNIETDIRAIKHIFKAEQFYSKSPSMLTKELLLRFTAYNLLRRIIARAAIRVGLLPRQISFSTAITYTRMFGNMMLRTQDPREREDLMARYLDAIRYSKLPNRKRRRSEPRKVVNHKKKFPPLHGARKTRYYKNPANA